MTTYKRVEVVLLPFPFTDQTGSKRRPAVILSCDAYNRRRSDVIVAPITSNLGTGQVDDTHITDWAVAGLLKPSVVKGVLGSVQQSLIIRTLGTLSNSDIQNVEQHFAEILNLKV